jgi:hypothetical protein
MISAGRHILQRSLGVVGVGAGSDDDSAPFVTVSPSKSAERRRRLVDRLKTSEEQNGYFLDPAADGSPKDQQSGPTASVSPRKTMDACRNAARILKQSGERLHLSGRWWRETETHTANRTGGEGSDSRFEGRPKKEVGYQGLYRYIIAQPGTA